MRAALATAATAALALLAAAPAHGVEVTRSAEGTGVSVNGLTDPRGNLRPFAGTHARLVHEAGIRSGRSDAFWQWAEPWAPPPLLRTRSYEWRGFDRLAGLLAVHDIRWFPVIAYSTYWASSYHGEDRAPPKDNADYVAYAQAFARRYGRGGSFWADRPDVPALPVTDYEVWNEPNLPYFWQPKPDPARYAELYLATRTALREVDPDSRSVMAGMHAVAGDYTKAMYAARPELRGNVDVFAYHPYGPTAENVLSLVRKMRATLDGLGETHVPLWITELGWPTRGRGGLSAPPLPDPTRAGNLALVTDALLGSNCAVQRIYPYTWVTPESDPDHDEQWLGIYRKDGTPTEAGRSYRESVGRHAAAAGKPRAALRVCTNRARDGGKFAKPLRLGVAVRATGRGCHQATVTYRGRPLNGVEVTFTAGRRKAVADTDVNGVARRCLGASKAKAAARLLDAASGSSPA